MQKNWKTFYESTGTKLPVYEKPGSIFSKNEFDLKKGTKDKTPKVPEKTIVRTGTDKSGRKVVKYSDGTVAYAD